MAKKDGIICKGCGLKLVYEYAEMVPRPNQTEYDQIKASYKLNGQHEKIKIRRRDNGILDGYTRHQIICIDDHSKPKTEVKEFPSIIHEKLYVIENNFRRNLNDLQKAKLALKLIPLEKALAKDRQYNSTALGSNEPKGKAIDRIAKKSGLSPTTFFRAAKVIEDNGQLLKDVEAKKTSIARAYTKLVKQERPEKKTPSLPKGQYNVILCDSPLRFDQELRGSASAHYKTYLMKDFIKTFPEKKMPFAKNAVLFIWIPASMLFEVKDLLDEWKFKYKTHAIWVKTSKNGLRIGLGSYFRSAHEILLLCTKGKMPIPEPSKRPASVIMAPRKEHSEKPEIIHKLIKQMYPNCQYLELFGRKQVKGWKVFGDESKKT